MVLRPRKSLAGSFGMGSMHLFLEIWSSWLSRQAQDWPAAILWLWIQGTSEQHFGVLAVSVSEQIQQNTFQNLHKSWDFFSGLFAKKNKFFGLLNFVFSMLWLPPRRRNDDQIHRVRASRGLPIPKQILLLEKTIFARRAIVFARYRLGQGKRCVNRVRLCPSWCSILAKRCGFELFVCIFQVQNSRNWFKLAEI